MPRVSAEDSVLYAKMKEALRGEYFFTTGTEVNPSQKMMCGITEDYYGSVQHHTLWTHILVAGQDVVTLPQMVLEMVLGQRLSLNVGKPKKARLDVRILRKGAGGTIAISKIVSLVDKTITSYGDLNIYAPQPGVSKGALAIPEYTIPGHWREDMQWHCVPSVRHLIIANGGA